MADELQLLRLLEEMLESEKTPEEVCRNCPDLLPQVRERWKEFCCVDEAYKALLPGLRPRPRPRCLAPVFRGFPAMRWRRCWATAAWG